MHVHVHSKTESALDRCYNTRYHFKSTRLRLLEHDSVGEPFSFVPWNHHRFKAAHHEQSSDLETMPIICLMCTVCFYPGGLILWRENNSV